MSPELRPPLTQRQITSLRASDGVRLIKEAFDDRDCALLVDWMVEFNAQANVFLQKTREPIATLTPPSILIEAASRAGVDGTLTQLAVAFMRQLDCPFTEEEMLESTLKRAAEIATGG